MVLRGVAEFVAQKCFDRGARACHVGVLTVQPGGKHAAHYLQDRSGDDRRPVLRETRAVVSGRCRIRAAVDLEGAAMYMFHSACGLHRALDRQDQKKPVPPAKATGFVVYAGVAKPCFDGLPPRGVM